MAGTEGATDDAMPVPIGIFADRGVPLPGLNSSDMTALIAREQNPSDAERASQAREAAITDFALTGELDPADLAQAGWGVIFQAGVDNKAFKDALKPLLDRRREQAGGLFKVFENEDGYRSGERAVDWLERHGSSLAVVDPSMGVPFYLLLIGSPLEIPFEFQYTLDIFWGVGRVHFASAADLRHYAEGVVTYETTAMLPHRRQIALFSTRHDFDRATQLFARLVAEPMTQQSDRWAPIGKRQNFALRSFIGDAATKSQLTDIFSGNIPAGPPALLFTGSHGMAFRADDPRLPSAQGALVCQDWQGFGAIGPQDWFAASDLPVGANLHGLIHFFFACYGLGCPRYDHFNRLGPAPRQIAPEEMVAALPQAMLGREGGALAALGHVDRAWAFSFQSTKAEPQLQSFRDVIGGILRGQRLGQATDQLNVRWGALSASLLDEVDRRAKNTSNALTDQKLASLWVARDDARNYIVFGDPAVRLRVEDMPILA
jgi:hypothetical protein